MCAPVFKGNERIPAPPAAGCYQRIYIWVCYNEILFFTFIFLTPLVYPLGTLGILRILPCASWRHADLCQALDGKTITLAAHLVAQSVSLLCYVGSDILKLFNWVRVQAPEAP